MNLKPKRPILSPAARCLPDYETAFNGFKSRGVLDTVNQSRTKLVGRELVSKGGISETVVDLKIIFGFAFQHQATNIFLIHNHPSGNLKPSHPDIQMTKRIVEAGKILDIKILDHLIIAEKSYY